MIDEEFRRRLLIHLRAAIRSYTRTIASTDGARSNATKAVRAEAQAAKADAEAVIAALATLRNDGAGLREAVQELLLVIDAEVSIGPGEYITRALDKVRAALQA
jgi:hypothetical protein